MAPSGAGPSNETGAIPPAYDPSTRIPGNPSNPANSSLVPPLPEEARLVEEDERIVDRELALFEMEPWDEVALIPYWQVCNRWSSWVIRIGN